MKIAFMGAGGVGGFYGGRLANAGYDVSFIARGEHLNALRQHGLTIENEPQGDIHVPRVTATDDPASLGEVDVLVMAVKLWDTERAAKFVKPLVGPKTAVVSFQNGVIKDDILRRAFGDDAVIGGVGYVATHISRPGVIHQTGTMQRVIVGEYDGTRSERVAALHAALLEAGIKAEISDDIRRTLWEKYVFLVGLSGSTTTMRSTIGPIRQNAQTRAFLHDLMKETVAVGRAHGVNLPGRLRRSAAGVRRHHGCRYDVFDAPRPEQRQPARSSVAVWRRRRAGRAGRGSDAGQSGGMGRPRPPCRRQRR